MKNRPFPFSGGRRLGLLVFFITSGILLISLFVEDVGRYPTLCLFRAITTIPCPSCGMTRGFVAMGHGNVSEAFSKNIFSPVLYLATLMIWLFSLVQVIFGINILERIWYSSKRVVVTSVLILMMISWIVNIYRRFG